VWPDRGYIRIRMTLSNGDFLQVAEYFVIQDGECVTHRYRYQWMDGQRRELRERWDNVEHYPDLPNFPHHVHVGGEKNVEPGERLSVLSLLLSACTAPHPPNQPTRRPATCKLADLPTCTGPLIIRPAPTLWPFGRLRVNSGQALTIKPQTVGRGVCCAGGPFDRALRRGSRQAQGRGRGGR